MRKIGENIRFYRNLRQLTQTALARKVQVAPAYISQIEANQRVPSLKVTRRIANVLGIEMSVLVREADPRAQEGRLSDSEKLDLLRTLIMAIEGESRTGDESDAVVRTAESRECVVTEIHSEPAYCVFLREFTASGPLGGEAEEGTVECHVVLEGRIRSVEAGVPRDLGAGGCVTPSSGAERHLTASRGARLLSVYAPRVPLAALVSSEGRSASGS